MTVGTDQDRITSTQVATFLDHALAGRVKSAVGVALDLLDSGMSVSAVVSDLLAPAQREVGKRWEENTLSVAEEHLATGSADAAVYALAMAHTTRQVGGRVLLACAEGDWHSTASHMFAVQLEAADVGVNFLGASTPAGHVAKLLGRSRPDALIVSCTMPIHFAGVTRLVDAAHAVGLPVLVGGGALADDGRENARRLGGDAWAPDAAGAVAILAEWRTRTPAVSQGPTPLPSSALFLDRQAQSLAIAADDVRADRSPAAGDASPLTGLSRDDLMLILQFNAAAQLVQSDRIFLSFLGWLERVLTTRGLPHGSLRAELEALATLLPTLPPSAVALLRLGATSLEGSD